MNEERARGAEVTGRPGIHYSFAILVLGVLTITLALGLGRFAYTMILPGMREGLGLTYAQTGFLATGNFVGYSLFALVGGLLAARLGPRVVIGVGAAVVGVTMFLTGLAQSFEVALILRFLTGLGSAACVVSATGLQVAWFTPQRRGLATGALSGGGGIGLVLSGFLVPLAVVYFAPEGWRYAWFFFGAIALVICAVDIVFLRDNPRELGLRPFGPGQGEPTGDLAPTGPAPLRSVFKTPALYHLAITFAVWGFSYIIFATYFAAFLGEERGFDTGFVGQLWATAGAISIVSGLMWGSISDAIGRRNTLAIVFVLQSGVFFSLARVDSLAGLWSVTVLYGLTAWSIPAIMGATAGDCVGPRLASAAVGFVTLVFGIGQAIGPSVAGYLADSTGSFEPAFMLSAFGAALGCVLSLFYRAPPAKTE